MQAVCWKQNVCFQKQANTHIFCICPCGFTLVHSRAAPLYFTAEVISDQKATRWRLYSLPTSHTSSRSQAYLYLVFPHLILILTVFCCLQALLTQKQKQNTKCTCKERNAPLPFRVASVSEPWEMGGVTTRSGRVSNGNWKENSRKPVAQLTAECFSICKAVLNPQETLRINFLLSFLSA